VREKMREGKGSEKGKKDLCESSQLKMLIFQSISLQSAGWISLVFYCCSE
jgi:hypothetical protein